MNYADAQENYRSWINKNREQLPTVTEDSEETTYTAGYTTAPQQLQGQLLQRLEDDRRISTLTITKIQQHLNQNGE